MIGQYAWRRNLTINDDDIRHVQHLIVDINGCQSRHTQQIVSNVKQSAKIESKYIRCAPRNICNGYRRPNNSPPGCKFSVNYYEMIISREKNKNDNTFVKFWLPSEIPKELRTMQVIQPILFQSLPNLSNANNN
jgi:hypothetical protein